MNELVKKALEIAKDVFEPLNDKIILFPLEPETKTTGGVILPDIEQSRLNLGVVMATGTGILIDDGTRIELQLNPGDTILFKKYDAFKIRYKGIMFYIIKENDISTKLKNIDLDAFDYIENTY